jgi:flagellar protein FlbD
MSFPPLDREDAMIKLTRLDGEPFILNADLIRYIESRPDTFVTLTTGERVVVTETMDEVVERAIRYQQTKHLIPSPVAPRRKRDGET